MDARKFDGSENPSSTFLEALEFRQRRGEFFAGFGHVGLLLEITGACEFARSWIHNYIMLCYYKSMMLLYCT